MMGIKKLVNAASVFLDRRGYEILDRDDDALCQLVAKDKDQLVFVKVKELPSEFNEANYSDEVTSAQRFELETFTCEWYSKHPDVGNGPLRFDVVGIRVISGDRAMVRHHINAMSVSNSKVETEDE